MAKSGTELEDEDERMNKMITEGGVEAGVEKVKRAGMRRVVRWSHKARVNYVHWCTIKGNLQAW